MITKFAIPTNGDSIPITPASGIKLNHPGKFLFSYIFHSQINMKTKFAIGTKKKNGKTECRILDLKGNDIKTVYVPYPELHGMDYMPEYDILNKTFYILIENEDEEVWELHTKQL